MELEQRLRASAEAYGRDPDAAVERAKQVARTTALSSTAALDREIRLLGDDWIVGKRSDA